jgi:hypothetical protein
MKTWVDLYRSHREMRTTAGETSRDIRVLLGEIARLNPEVLDAGVTSRFTYVRSTASRLRHYRLAGNDGGECLNVPSLRAARLDVQLLQDSRSFHIHELTVMLTGQTNDGRPWVLAVHLPDDRAANSQDGDQQGSGACGHASLHCHTGPTLDALPTLRVPLPKLTPAEVLAWVLSQVIPGFEPAPWNEVVGTLDGA